MNKQNRKRSYKQNCALARATDVIGERWTLLLLRDLMVNPRRFKDLLASLKGIGTNLLTNRLKALESFELIERETGVRGEPLYALSERGRALEPTVLALIRWGLLYGPENQVGDHHRDDWDLLALKALFQPERADTLAVRVQFEGPLLQGWAAIRGRQMDIGLGNLDSPDLVIDGTVADVFLGPSDPDAFIRDGDRATLRRFMSAFALRA